ncbi:DUF2269 family protein [Alysiella filiformis]|uniref:Uncharacterized membrane protein n=1 Tax=Alysiella filiformis DSM 16848 TaxID=1120981 RepID=A0A286E1R7_9NEIS|nr:DUF2269 domain-containing protein [Alysiella filiformis]QMT30782.1 DUF2269 domain-containing protein [Alysiella filiformis]UBQ56236.1 DUF2269 domain-containing protein [Alysiella filiformis DSM 16848]SOD64833.1 Uncharacterized membrane protein [Alysiella filiformis DSM 16848]
MNTYLIVKTLHIISSVLMVGTGFGTAFYLFWANRSGSVAAQAVVAKWVMKADWWFTTPAVIFQPLSGLWLLNQLGMPFTWDGAWLWVKWTLALYALAGVCWLPVVWLQIKMAKMAQAAYAKGENALPPEYKRYQMAWEWLGYPAFCAMFAVFFLMVLKPM